MTKATKSKKKIPVWLKRLLIAVGVIFVLGGSYIIYLLNFKEYDTADSEVSEITTETYKIDLPDGTSIELDEDGNIIETDDNGSTEVGSSENGTPTNGSTEGTSTDSTSTDSGSGTNSSSTNNGTNSNGTSGSGGGTAGSTSGGSSGNGGTSTGGTTENGSNNGKNEGSGETVATIKAKYEPVMTSLQSQANGRIDALVGRAYSEYQGKKASGESINYAYFYNKYTSAASELEGRTDKVFYQVISVMEKELVANGYGKSHADTLISEYEAQKKARRDALLSKAMNR